MPLSDQPQECARCRELKRDDVREVPAAQGQASADASLPERKAPSSGERSKYT